MAVEKTTITGKVYMPNGSAAAGGSILIRLSQRGTVLDGAVVQVVNGQVRVPIAADGSVSFTLIPNESITPSGTFYVAEYSAPDGFKWKELWEITINPDPMEIGAIAQVAGSVSIPEELTFPSLSALPAPSLSYRRKVKVIEGGVGIPDQAVICLKAGTQVAGADVYEWVTLQTGGP